MSIGLAVLCSKVEPLRDQRVLAVLELQMCWVPKEETRRQVKIVGSVSVVKTTPALFGSIKIKVIQQGALHSSLGN